MPEQHNDGIDWQTMVAPFPPTDIEWRISRAGRKGNGELWAKVLAYVTNRAIMDRLDDVVGPDNWCNEYREWHGQSQLCGLSIRINGQWVTKWDGADNTQFEGTKGGLSDSMKRAAVQWGIGRYLYHLGENWAQIVSSGGRYYAGNVKIKSKGKEEYVSFGWNPPNLPKHALPQGAETDRNTPPQKPSANPSQELRTLLQEKCGAKSREPMDAVIWLASAGHRTAADCKDPQIAKEVKDAIEKLANDGIAYGKMVEEARKQKANQSETATA